MKLGKLGKLSSGILELGASSIRTLKLGSASFGMLKLGELGEMSFGTLPIELAWFDVCTDKLHDENGNSQTSKNIVAIFSIVWVQLAFKIRRYCVSPICPHLVLINAVMLTKKKGRVIYFYTQHRCIFTLIQNSMNFVRFLFVYL